jgi:hypothetical protein
MFFAKPSHTLDSVALISIFCASREVDIPLDKTCFRISLMRKNRLSRLRTTYGLLDGTK